MVSLERFSIFSCNSSPGEIFDRITGPPWRDIKKSFTFRYYSYYPWGEMSRPSDLKAYISGIKKPETGCSEDVVFET